MRDLFQRQLLPSNYLDHLNDKQFYVYVITYTYNNEDILEETVQLGFSFSR